MQMMKNIQIILRLVLALVLLFAGLNKVFLFVSDDFQLGPAADFYSALLDTGYMMVMVAFIELLVGIALLVNRFVPLALLILAPFSVNILFFHLFLDIEGVGAALLVSILNGYLFFQYRAQYQLLLKAKND